MKYEISDKSMEILKLQPRGQVTIPANFRRQMGIGPDSLIKAYLEGERLIIAPVRVVETGLIRKFSKNEVNEFMKEDQLSAEERANFDKLVKSVDKSIS